MAAPQRFRVLRCCSCRLFQVHQLKKSLKWTCKSCGEKQSFLRAYGEGSGADCRRHVQKLNLLQGQVSEMSLRSLGGFRSASEEEIGGHQQAENVNPQGQSQPSESRWLKFLDKDSPALEPGGVCFHRQPSSKMEDPDPPFSQELPRKRKWSPSTAQTAHSCDTPGLGDAEGTWEPRKGSTGLTKKVKEDGSHCFQNSVACSTRELRVPREELPSPAWQVKATSSKWTRYLPSPVDSSQVDTEPQEPAERGLRTAGPAQAEQGTQTPKESWEAATVQFPQVTHTPRPGSERPSGNSPEQWWGMGTQAEGGSSVPVSQTPPALQLCDLFTTGEDFSDDL
ncbi:MRN complex-interacting protein [Oryctolagus cuniculus]|uniref:MRN complex-interacting protein n=1 Tax=Oryctolagus cuniculus TaxID=9986 RepID=UPI00387A501E